MLKKMILCLLLIPAMTWAIDIKISNNSDMTGTARFESSICPCSSQVGEILNGHSSITLPSKVVSLFCHPGRDCFADLYDNTSCSGQSIARVKIDNNTGVTSVDNLDPQKFVVSGSGGDVEINSVSQRKTGWLTRIFHMFK